MQARVSFGLTVAFSAGLIDGAALAARAAPPGANQKITIGWCASTKDLEKAKAAGFDFVELGVRQLAGMSDAEFAEAKAGHEKVGLPTPVGNLFVPPEIRLTGPDAKVDEQRQYVRKALDRARAFGLKIVVFGSGGARNVPDGFSRDQAFKQLVAFGRLAAAEAKPRGITVALEPLRRKESNIMNSAAEGLTLVKAIRHPNFALMVDIFHMAEEKEAAAIILNAGKLIRHVHIANPRGRVFPLEAAEFSYAPYFQALRKIGFRGGVSVEASTKDFDRDAPRSIALLRALARGDATANLTP
jgi:sugar phosphate isomerase/epimerase